MGLERIGQPTTFGELVEGGVVYLPPMDAEGA